MPFFLKTFFMVISFVSCGIGLSTLVDFVFLEKYISQITVIMVSMGLFLSLACGFFFLGEMIKDGILEEKKKCQEFFEELKKYKERIE